MRAVIMAGGEGTRLRPLTCNLPKPMIPIMERPVLEYIIELLKKNDIRDIAITVQYLSDEIINYFQDGRKFGVSIEYFKEEVPLGTAGSIKNAENFLKETFLVISGDALTDIDLSKVIEFHREKQSLATLVLKEVNVPLEYGVVITGKNHRIRGFLEKPGWSEVFSDKVNTGIYILEPKIFNFFNKGKIFDFSSDLFPLLLSENIPMYGYLTEGYWCDIGNIDQYLHCHRDILDGKVNINVKGKEVKKGIWIGEDCDISPNVNIESPAFIGSNSKIQDGTVIGAYTVLGKNNIVSSYASIKRSVLLDYCYVGAKAEIRGALLCSKSQLGNKACILERSTIGENTLIGEKAVVKTDVKIWPNKEIENSTIVKNNLIWGGKYFKAIFGKDGICGEVNVDITPEFVSKIGSCYGAILPSDSRVAISCNDNGAAQMFKYSLAAGLLSMGVEVYDLERMTTSMTRHATVFFGVQGSIHVTVNREMPDKVNIIFMDENGLNIDKNLKRRIESKFIREEYRRIPGHDFKKIKYLNDCRQYYCRQLINRLNIKSIQNKRYKVILSIYDPLILSVIQEILGELKVSIKYYDDYNNINGFSAEVLKSGADLGLSIFNEGESSIIIDENGKVISNSLYEALNFMIMLEKTKLDKIVVPITASIATEEIAAQQGVDFIRTKNCQNEILKTFLNYEKKVSRRKVIDTFLMSIDVISTFVLILDYIAEKDVKLSNVISSIPLYYRKNKEIYCPWNLKGKVMRSLIESYEFMSIDLIEGVRLNFDDGWLLVLPDSEEPYCKIITECKNNENAEKITEEVIKKIQYILSSNIEE